MTAEGTAYYGIAAAFGWGMIGGAVGAALMLYVRAAIARRHSRRQAARLVNVINGTVGDMLARERMAGLVPRAKFGNATAPRMPS